MLPQLGEGKIPGEQEQEEDSVFMYLLVIGKRAEHLCGARCA